MRLALSTARDVISAVREFREWKEAKARKNEPARLRGHGVGSAMFRPRDASGFNRLRRRLRESTHFHGACDRLDALEREVRKCGVALPVPEEVRQNEDCSLGISWGGLTVLCARDGLAYLLGGSAGHMERGIKRPLIEALIIKARA